MRKLIFIFLMMVSSMCLAEGFVVYDATKYYGKAGDVHKYLDRVEVVYASDLWKNGENRDLLPSYANLFDLKNVVDSGRNVVLDVEHWLGENPTNNEVNTAASKYIDLVKDVRRVTSFKSLGYYGVIPNRDYWRSIKNSSDDDYIRWQYENSILGSIIPHVDVLYPSLYMFYDNYAQWEHYAGEQIRESRRLGRGKKVIPFIWPQYHQSNRFIGLRYIPRATWRKMLEFVYSQADGVVVWGGWNFTSNSPLQWNEKAPWWLETVEFVKSKKVAPQSPGLTVY